MKKVNTLILFSIANYSYAFNAQLPTYTRRQSKSESI